MITQAVYKPEIEQFIALIDLDESDNYASLLNALWLDGQKF